jgi:cytochrome oxidase Cu insertion factor (SCO1/SenC/PrrC family)
MKPTTQTRRGRMQLIVVATLCFLPFIGAIVVTQYFPDWSPFGTANHGRLISPIVSVGVDGLASIDGKAASERTLQGKWSLILFSPGPCIERCLEQLAETAEMQLLLNKDGGRLQRILVVPDNLAVSLSQSEVLATHINLQLMTASPSWRERFSIAGDQPERSKRVYLVDPQGFLMMFYASDAAPRLMLKDFKRLLKTSRLG